MGGESSFDIVSKIDMQEMKNAVDQTLKEIGQRFDLKDSRSEIILEENEITITSSDEYKLKAVVDILQSKMVKRGISLKAITLENMEDALGGRKRQKISLQQGIPIEAAREIVKEIKGGKFKVQSQIQGDQVRVSSKSKDELQTVITFLKKKDFKIHMQFVNYR
ncbi:MAG: YajQ family cyclic di-GMP-binding protein [Nitrospirae bacterium]|nr:YajQ family cyclic di-GMP-binding protein [Nitrospirota bacterium]